MGIILNLTYTDNLSNGYGDLSIEQGADYSKVAFNYPGNISTWTAKGSIRRRWLDYEQGISPLATFSFPVIAYNSATEKTLITPFLSASQTASIPHTCNRLNKSIHVDIGKNVYVYDIDLISPTGNIIRLTSGYVEVLPAVTS